MKDYLIGKKTVVKKVEVIKAKVESLNPPVFIPKKIESVIQEKPTSMDTTLVETIIADSSIEVEDEEIW